ncbi:hypothetical protein BOTCAL_0092g00090 [Botryotinia calthae]|uniref:Uncharacterized protein n=1 Tax=Botryotinia calthae TaxID=38488 RepID=A0A4Y8D6V5_9HELO|nr:hypothetical protein BOTCAL_0092g00090 [Botryotinia calthae]
MSQVFGPISPPPDTDTSIHGVKAVYITAHQVEGLARFCFYDLSSAMGELGEYINEDYSKKSDRKNVREKFTKGFMCQAKFEECYEKLKAERVSAGKSSWATAVSPYSQF